MRSRKAATWTLLPLTLACLCARGAGGAEGKPAEKAVKPAAQDLVFPPPPDEPRLRWLRGVSKPKDLAGGERNGFWRKLGDFLAGRQGEELPLSRPYGVWAQGERLYVADTESSSVVILDKAKPDIERLGGGAQGRLTAPIGVAVDASSRVFVTDAAADLVKAFDAQGRVLWQAGALGEAGALKRPTGVAAGRRGEVVVADTGNSRIVVLNADKGTLRAAFGGKGARDGELSVPTNVWAEPDGTILVSDTILCRVSAFAPDGRFLFAFGQCGDMAGYLARPRGVASDSDGNIYVVDALFDAVQVFDRQGRLLLFFGGHGAGAASFQLPAGLCIDEQDRVYVADSGNRRIQVFQYLKRR